MKKLIYSNSHIFGMAFPRKKCLDRLEALSKELNNHIIKCVVYYQTRPDDLSHWISEISNFIAQANKIKCNSKLKKKDYMESIFADFGDEWIDANVNLEQFQLIEKDYPEFDPEDKNLIDTLYQMYQLIIDTCIPVFNSKDIRSSDEWYKILYPKIQKILS